MQRTAGASPFTEKLPCKPASAVKRDRLTGPGSDRQRDLTEQHMLHRLSTRATFMKAAVASDCLLPNDATNVTSILVLDGTLYSR